MTDPSGGDDNKSFSAQRRRPRAGERTRGSADALQTKIAVNLQQLDRASFEDQLRDNIAELPDAFGCDAAFLALIDNKTDAIGAVYASSSVFCACNPQALSKDSLDNWPWLMQRLGHLRVVEIAGTDDAPAGAAEEFARLAELSIGSCLTIGFSIRGEMAGFLAVANERPVGAWDANQHLLIKLIGTSLASGLERMRTKEILDELEER
ncbi:MAG: GAF domain-containing protein, partial [Woeseia sp.]